MLSVCLGGLCLLLACQPSDVNPAGEVSEVLSDLPAPTSWELQAIDPFTVRISWELSSYIAATTQLHIERRGTSDADFVELEGVEGDMASFDDVNLQPETSYSYRLRLSRNDGYSPYSGVSKIRTYPLAEEGTFLIRDTFFYKGSKGTSTCESHYLAYSLNNYESGTFGAGPIRYDSGSGRFRVVLTNDGWSFVDPEGYLFFGAGINSVPPAENFSQIKLPEDLRSIGLNHLANWSAFESINKAGPPMPYTTRELFLQGYKNLEQRTKDLFDDGVIPVFDPEFEYFADLLAQQVAEKYANDPYCIGIFSDNELPLYSNEKYGDLLSRFLQIEDKTDPNYLAARDWMITRSGTADFEWTDADSYDWHGFLAASYYRTVNDALKKHAPDVLFLGSRLHGAAKGYANIFVESAPYVDVFSINYYGPCTPDPEQMDMWETGVDKPFLISEFYAKGFDVDLDNSGGAGYHVPTQGDRALYFENFVLALLSRRNCVGYQWFRFQDDASNKGLVDAGENWYAPLRQSFEKVNKDLYQLRSFLRNE